MNKMREFFQTIQNSWLNRVVAFDTGTQRYIVEMMRARFHEFTSWMNATALEIWSGLREIVISGQASWKARIAVTIGFLWCAAAGSWLIRKWLRRRRSLVAQIIKQLDPKTQRQLEHELGFFDDLLHLLEKTGDVKTRNYTPREYVEHLSPRLGSATVEALWLVELFYAIRFGQAHLTPATVLNIQSRMGVVREKLAAV
jgi:hypothetical protein